MARRKYRLIVMVRADDVFELPVCVAGSVDELSRMTGLPKYIIYYGLQGPGAEIWHHDGWHRVVDCSGEEER